mgnify:CR=1 FL=1
MGWLATGDLFEARFDRRTGTLAALVLGIPAAYAMTRFKVPGAETVKLIVSSPIIVPGIIGLLTLVVTTIVTALSVAREREAGTFDQLLVTPLRPFEILVGKAIPSFLLGMFDGLLLSAGAVIWFGVPMTGTLTVTGSTVGSSSRPVP